MVHSVSENIGSFIWKSLGNTLVLDPKDVAACLFSPASIQDLAFIRKNGSADTDQYLSPACIWKNLVCIICMYVLVFPALSWSKLLYNQIDILQYVCQGMYYIYCMCETDRKFR